ncbi:MAG: hypothetical protein ACC628_27980 [Pirellulaceae bacterium]
MCDALTTRQVARAISDSLLIGGTVDEWQIRRLFEDGSLAEPPKFGGKRMINRDRLPEIVAALISRGWLPNPRDRDPEAVACTEGRDKAPDEAPGSYRGTTDDGVTAAFSGALAECGDDNERFYAWRGITEVFLEYVAEHASPEIKREVVREFEQLAAKIRPRDGNGVRR